MADPAGNSTSLSLLERIRHNDQAAWSRVLSLYTALVRYWCSRGGCRPEYVDDVVQEVFLAASTSFKNFRRDRPGDTFRGWLRGITRNTLLLHYRRTGRQPLADGGSDALSRLGAIPDPAGGDEDDPPAEVSALYRRSLELVRAEFEQKTWDMFWRAVVDGRSPTLIAEEMGVSPAAVRKAKSRVLRRLKAELGELIE